MTYTLDHWNDLDSGTRASIVAAGLANPATRFNATNENISWAQWSWNPITGCRHGCPYCYARDIANRFYPEKFEPTFHPDRLGGPIHQRPPKPGAAEGERAVFTVSMGDLFGRWVPQEWIDAVFEATRRAPAWRFLFLTKNLARLAEQVWPPNAWVGTTIDSQARIKAAEAAFKNVKAAVCWLSCEPLLEPLRFERLDLFQWIVIGARSQTTGAAAMQPEHEWVEDLTRQARTAGCSVYIKPNYITPAAQCFKEYPLTDTRQNPRPFGQASLF
jgi:protein gp37